MMVVHSSSPPSYAAWYTSTTVMSSRASYVLSGPSSVRAKMRPFTELSPAARAHVRDLRLDLLPRRHVVARQRVGRSQRGVGRAADRGASDRGRRARARARGGGRRRANGGGGGGGQGGHAGERVREWQIRQLEGSSERRHEKSERATKSRCQRVASVQRWAPRDRIALGALRARCRARPGWRRSSGRGSGTLARSVCRTRRRSSTRSSETRRVLGPGPLGRPRGSNAARRRASLRVSRVSPPLPRSHPHTSQDVAWRADDIPVDASDAHDVVHSVSVHAPGPSSARRAPRSSSWCTVSRTAGGASGRGVAAHGARSRTHLVDWRGAGMSGRPARFAPRTEAEAIEYLVDGLEAGAGRSSARTARSGVSSGTPWAPSSRPSTPPSTRTESPTSSSSAPPPSRRWTRSVWRPS